MESTLQTLSSRIDLPDYRQAWDLVLGQLQLSMSQGMFETWVLPLQPLEYREHVFKVGAANPYARDWVDSRLKSTISRQLEGLLNDTIELKIEVATGFSQNETRTSEPEEETPALPSPKIKPEPRTRKMMLQRAYGSKRASVIQPERGLFLTQYLFSQWLPLLGHSAFTIILAARSMCYWNPITGELRNTIETEMAELASRASVSVRTVKDVLNNELVQRYFLRYKVRRIMTSNGVRTAGISLNVRMDDPLTPQDQEALNLSEEDHWYTADFELFPDEE